MKTFFYKLFGFGKVHEPLLNELKSEGIVVLDDGIRSTITYINFRAPGRYSNWKRRWFSGAVALTEKRLVLQQYSKPVIDLELSDKRFQKLKISLESEDTLLFEFEPELFLENSSGQIEWRCRTPQAKAFIEAIHEKLK